MPRNRKLVILAGLVVTALLLFYFSGFDDFLSAPQAQLFNFVRERPLLAASFYLPVYLAFVSFGAPSVPFQIAAATLFIPTWGYARTLALMLFAINLATLTTFGLGRWVDLDLFRVRRSPKLSRLNAELKKRGSLWIVVLRLIPAVPFSMLSYGAAVCQIPAARFFAASAIGSAPITIVHASIGKWAAKKLNRLAP